ncbi:hypothetical protein GCM10008023_39170 [Sphingomonas glacialis]|uniref:DUF1269 domain-containing protein n=1 Tax=Sphingomonas glacialis TaxID=658225 RepID=A0ABQ3LTC7_9SPHN|nr:hypothetical protein [Sphingomonas glacialis]GHH25622.1 hypothetical protein GCM10008023_39170 [Sphingomonas glacialis]
MDNYVAIIFDDHEQARAGLQALWVMDKVGDLTVHGASIVRRSDLGGYVDVSSKKTHNGFRTAAGIGLGALLGAVAGPIGMVLGAAGAATIATGAAVAIGGVVGGAVGGAADLAHVAENEAAEEAMIFLLKRGQYAVLTEVSETAEDRLDNRMKALSGTIRRRSRTDVLNDDFGASYYNDGLRYPYYNTYLYPYYYDPYYL